MKYLRFFAVSIFGIFMALALPPQASASPGQCINTPFGGFCDGNPWKDGSFNHCESSGWGGFSYSNCFQACQDGAGRIYATDFDANTPC